MCSVIHFQEMVEEAVRAINTECFHRNQEAGRLGSMILRRKHTAKGYWRATFLQCIPATLVNGTAAGVAPALRTSSLASVAFRTTGSTAGKPMTLQDLTSLMVTEFRVVQPSCDSGWTLVAQSPSGLSSAGDPLVSGERVFLDRILDALEA